MPKRMTAVRNIAEDLAQTHERVAASSETRVKAPRAEDIERRELVLAMADALEDILQEEVRGMA